MRADCEIIVARDELVAALDARATVPLNHVRPGVVRLRPARGGVRVETAVVGAEIPGKGTWKRAIETDADRLAWVAGRYDDAALLLLYAAGTLLVNRTRIDAWEARPGVARRRVGRAINPPPWPVVRARQLSLRLDSAATLAALARRPLAARRHQRDAGDLPLFER